MYNIKSSFNINESVIDNGNERGEAERMGAKLKGGAMCFLSFKKF